MIAAKALGMIFALFNVVSSLDLSFCQPLQLQCFYNDSTTAHLCSSLYFNHFLTSAYVMICGTYVRNGCSARFG